MQRVRAMTRDIIAAIVDGLTAGGVATGEIRRDRAIAGMIVKAIEMEGCTIMSNSMVNSIIAMQDRK